METRVSWTMVIEEKILTKMLDDSDDASDDDDEVQRTSRRQ